MKVRKIDLRKAVHKQSTVNGTNVWIKIGALVFTSETKEQLADVVFDTVCPTWLMIDRKQFDEIDDVEVLKERILVHLVSKKLADIHRKENSRKGPKTDRLRRFFDAIKNEPVNAVQLAEQFFIMETTLKNHRRYDVYPERGLTKITKGMIFRLPLDD
jgi:hypothetical protein